MRSYGLLIAFTGLIFLILFWYEYFTLVDKVLIEKYYLYLILFFGLIITIVSGIMIGLGFKILLKPELYQTIKMFLKK
jgi:hypothetical protein